MLPETTAILKSSANRLGRNGFRQRFSAFDLCITIQEAAGGEELGVEQGGAGSAADQVVREQCQLYVEERAFADAADHGGHAVAGIYIAARLRAIFFVENDYRI